MRSTAQRDAARALYQIELLRKSLKVRKTDHIVEPFRQAIRVLGLKRDELAAKLYVSQQMLRRLVHGRKKASPLIVAQVHRMLAKQNALNAADMLKTSQIVWCKKSYKMDPVEFLDHLPYCGDCMAATLKAAEYF